MKIFPNYTCLCFAVALSSFISQPIAAQSSVRHDAAERMRKTVNALSSSDMEGRAPGTSGLEASSELIRSEFHKAGLKSGVPDGSFWQNFAYIPAGSSKETQLRNVIGILEGSGPHSQETIILGAHYDHLGLGPASSAAQGSQEHSLYPGADDNASGVAVLLELARHFGMNFPTGRRMVFIAFSGEEEGTLGSRYYVAHPVFPLLDTIAMINFDMVGRVREKTVGIAGDKSGDSFDAILDQAGANSPLKLFRGGDEYPDDSDHAPFAKARIPILYVCSGSHDDRHRPSDTPEKINAEGMADIAELMENTIDLLLTSVRPHFVPRSS